MLSTQELLKATDKPLLYSNFVKRLRFDNARLDPDFVYRFWSYLYQKQRMFVYEKRTTGIRNFKLGDFLANERIVVPPLAEQRSIALVLHKLQLSNRHELSRWAAERKLI